MKTILKDEEKIRLLKEMFAACNMETNEFEAKRFRANHHEHRDKIDELERAQFITRSNNIYTLNLIALAELEESIPPCKTILDICEVIFRHLKQEYLQEPEQTIHLINLEHMFGIDPNWMFTSTPYLLQASIFGSYNIDETQRARVTTREEILDYENFRQCIERLQGYSLRSAERFANFQDLQQCIHDTSSFDQGLTDIKPLLHPEIIKHAYSQYKNGHLREAVLNSVMALSDMIREKTGLEEDGDRLIGKAFSSEKPYLKVNKLSNESERNDQAGFIQMLKGAYQGIRNPKAHSLTHDLNKLNAAQYIVFASLLASRIEESEVIRTHKKAA